MVQWAIHFAISSSVPSTAVVPGGRRCFCTALALSRQVPNWQLSAGFTVLTKTAKKNKVHFPFQSLKTSVGVEL
jgi:hypothetical protein